MHSRVVDAPALALALAGLLAAGCGSAALDRAALTAPPEQAQSIWYGELTPTLYTSMSAAEQDAVVSVCLRYSDECFCTGTLVTPRVVLTAAHCIDHPHATLAAEDLDVRVGADHAQPSAVVDVVEVAFQDWRVSWADDLGVLVLAAAFPDATPLLYRQGGVDAMIGNQAQLVGFGTIENDDLNTRRYWTTLAVESVDASGIVVDGQGVTGIAPGDSGGPILYDFGDGVQVAGVASLSEPGWVYGALYASVTPFEAWIQGFIDANPSPDCQGTCAGMACGVDGGCFCGSCARGEACSGGQCQPIPAGSGGICATLTATSLTCTDGSCGGGEVCYTYASGLGSECGAACGHTPCATGDAGSYCFPVAAAGGGYVPLCFSRTSEPCDDEGDFCTAAGGARGFCIDPYQAGTPTCLTFCAPVTTCPEDRACVAAALTCADHCAGRECGSAFGCNCGTCTAPETCVDGVCQACSPQCQGRECGNDGCGGTCGTCDDGERCVTGQCQADTPVDAGSAGSDAGGALPDVSVSPGQDASVDEEPEPTDGCACRAGAPPAAGLLAVVLLVAAGRRRRRDLQARRP